MQVNSRFNSGMYASEMGSKSWTPSSILQQPCSLITGPLSLTPHWYCWTRVVSAAVLLRCEHVTVISKSSDRSVLSPRANSNLFALGLGDSLVQPWTIHEGDSHPAISTQRDTERAPSQDLRLGINHSQSPVFTKRFFLKQGREVKMAAFRTHICWTPHQAHQAEMLLSTTRRALRTFDCDPKATPRSQRSKRRPYRAKNTF